MRLVESASSQTIQSAVDVGDDVEIVTTKGTLLELEVTRISDKAIHGTAWNGKRWKVPFAAIKSIKVEEASGAKTSGLIIGILLLLGALVWVASEALDNAFGEGD